MNALVNIHLEQCRDYAWAQNRIKDVIRVIRTYYLLNCSARCAIIKKFQYKKKTAAVHLHLDKPDRMCFLMIL